MRKSYNGGMFGCTIQGSDASSTNMNKHNNDSILNAIEESSNLPNESGTIGAALGMTDNEAVMAQN